MCVCAALILSMIASRMNLEFIGIVKVIVAYVIVDNSSIIIAVYQNMSL